MNELIEYLTQEIEKLRYRIKESSGVEKDRLKDLLTFAVEILEKAEEIQDDL